MSQETGHGHYYVPAPSTYPMTGSIALLFMGFGAAFSVNKIPLGYGLLTIGFAILFYMMFCLVSAPWRERARAANSTSRWINLSAGE